MQIHMHWMIALNKKTLKFSCRSKALLQRKIKSLYVLEFSLLHELEYLKWH